MEILQYFSSLFYSKQINKAAHFSFANDSLSLKWCGYYSRVGGFCMELIIYDNVVLQFMVISILKGSTHRTTVVLLYGVWLNWWFSSGELSGGNHREGWQTKRTTAPTRSERLQETTEWITTLSSLNWMPNPPIKAKQFNRALYSPCDCIFFFFTFSFEFPIIFGLNGINSAYFCCIFMHINAAMQTQKSSVFNPYYYNNNKKHITCGRERNTFWLSKVSWAKNDLI